MIAGISLFILAFHPALLTCAPVARASHARGLSLDLACHTLAFLFFFSFHFSSLCPMKELFILTTGFVVTKEQYEETKEQNAEREQE